jgi:hypothetical protein
LKIGVFSYLPKSRLAGTKVDANICKKIENNFTSLSEGEYDGNA